MREPVASAVVGVLPLGKLQAAYDEHRYLDVWRATSELWQPSTDPDALSVEELIFAARMALRLGGPRLARSLFRRARKLAPENPQVRYFTEYLHVPRRLLLDDLLAFEATPDLGGDDQEARANWLGVYATIWARLRNMPRALELMRQAHALLPGSSWLLSVEADIWGVGDDWPSSLRVAEEAWELDPRSPWTNGSVANALMSLGKIEQAVERLTAAAAETQSAELVQNACWHQCAWTELLEGSERLQSLDKARQLAARIEPLAPLADRDFKANLARVWLDIATLSGDHAEMERWAQEVRSPFHREVLANLKQNPNGARIRLPYRRVLQRYAECVPASVSSALSASSIDVPVAEFAADVTFGGTAEWAAADWLRGRNLHVRFFSTTSETAWRLLEAGIGFMVTWPDDDGGHAVAIVGMDRAAGVVLAHDPSSLRTAEYLLRAFDESASPYGVLGMAAVRMERAAELDNLLPPEAIIVEAAEAQLKALSRFGPLAAQTAFSEAAVQFPDHPAIRELHAIQDMEEGRTGQALASFRALLGKFPQAPRLRLNSINALRALGDTALLRERLRSIVETRTSAGVEAGGAWVRPHPRYVSEYADLLRGSAGTRREAEILLRSVLRNGWGFAQAWHILADLRWDQRRVGEALLAYSIASFLAPHNEHYARAYVDVLAREGRLDEGLAWLEDRVRRLGRSQEGVSAWITWISVLEDRGYPERALAVYAQAAEQHPSSIALLDFGVPFLARMGRWEQSRAALDALAQSEGRAAFHEAAVAFHRMSGEPQVALEHAQAWVREAPRSMGARYAVLDLLRTLEGNSVAADLAALWMREHPANESFEEAFCDYARDGMYWRRIRVLRMRVKRNRDDGWAWRELLFAALADYEKADERRRQRMTPRIEAWFAEAGRVSHDHSAFLRAQALWQENRDQWRAAIDGYLETIRIDPENFYSYRRAWACAARLPKEEQIALWTIMEPIYLEIAQPLPNAVEMMGLLAGRLGVPETEAMVAGWQARRPDDPNVAEAAADLLVEQARGRSAAARALELLQGAVQRYPNHAGLRFSLARACRTLGEHERANEVFTELSQRKPNDNAALINLAWIAQREGETERALEILQKAREHTPHDPSPLDQKAQILIDSGRQDEALAVVEQALRDIPDSVQTYEWAIARFKQCNLPERAVEAARAGTRIFPRGAYLWLLLGRTLKESPELAAEGEIEACLRQSLRFNATLYEAADWLAVLLAERQQYEEAAALIGGLEPHMTDPSAARGRLAWIKRHRGEGKQAVEGIGDLLQHAPWYAWGWYRLLEWLNEDKDWDAAKRWLATVPPIMLNDSGFRQKRLELLEKAGADPLVTEPEWLALLADLPDDAPLHLRRFDALQKAKRMTEAAEVLRGMPAAENDNVYRRARLVDVVCFEKNFNAAVDDALLVCFVKVEESEWPANHVWEKMRSAGLLKEFSARFRTELKQGRQPAPRALILYAEDLLSRNAEQPRWFRQSWFNPATWQVHAFVRQVQRSSWVQAESLSRLMEALNKADRRRLVIACWRFMQAKNLENTTAWAQAGSAMINLKRRRAARTLLADWRTRKGVKMWMLANYLLALPRFTGAQRAVVIQTCEDGLSSLAHDHCARYLTYMAAEAYALDRNKTGLLTIWDGYAKYFNGTPEKTEFFPQWQRYLFDEIPVAVRQLSDSEQGHWGLLYTLYSKRIWNPSTRAWARRMLILLFRLMVFAAASGSLLKQLFR